MRANREQILSSMNKEAEVKQAIARDIIANQESRRQVDKIEAKSNSWFANFNPVLKFQAQRTLNKLTVQESDRNEQPPKQSLAKTLLKAAVLPFPSKEITKKQKNLTDERQELENKLRPNRNVSKVNAPVITSTLLNIGREQSIQIRELLLNVNSCIDAHDITKSLEIKTCSQSSCEKHWTQDSYERFSLLREKTKEAISDLLNQKLTYESIEVIKNLTSDLIKEQPTDILFQELSIYVKEIIGVVNDQNYVFKYNAVK